MTACTCTCSTLPSPHDTEDRHLNPPSCIHAAPPSSDLAGALCDATLPTETWGLMWCGLFAGHPTGGPDDGHRWFSDKVTANPRALATPAPASDALDAAWAEVEAALPEGWTLMVGHTIECRYCPGWWATASKRREDPPHYPQIISSENDRPRGEHHDPTPAAALRALAARLGATDAD